MDIIETIAWIALGGLLIFGFIDLIAGSVAGAVIISKVIKKEFESNKEK